jgi:prepilin-type N-terminal cleavage/methylation domain-containing protein
MCKCIRKTAQAGFTLLECLLATLLVGIAVAALVAANSSFTKVNGAAAELSTAEFLIEQIKELTDMLPGTDPDYTDLTFGCGEGSLALYDDVDDFNNKVFSPPITSDRQTLNEFPAYAQKITVVRVSESNFENIVTDNSTAFLRITVCVTLNGQEISSESWIRARRY